MMRKDRISDACRSFLYLRGYNGKQSYNFKAVTKQSIKISRVVNYLTRIFAGEINNHHDWTDPAVVTNHQEA